MMDYMTFVEKIKLNSNAISFLNSILKLVNKSDVIQLKELYGKDKEVFFSEVGQLAQNLSVDIRELFLYIYILLAIDSHNLYIQKGINDNIYFDTYKDISIWCNNCYRDFGIWGLYKSEWFYHHSEAKVLRLGRLQFIPVLFDRDLSFDNHKIKKNDMVLDVHIPQGSGFEHEECFKSYKYAREFFKDTASEIMCSSWLLYPGLREILPDGSNIIKFNTSYHIYFSDDESRQAEDRIFNRLCDKPSDYPQNTSLQKAVVKYLMSGKKLGYAKGIMIY